MFSWSFKKRFVYGSSALFLLMIPISTFLYFYLKKEPTCYDSILNQNERNIDCGGVCKNTCQNEIRDITIEWTRAFKVAPGRYNVLTSILNPNTQSITKPFRYSFSVYDENNAQLDYKEGYTSLPTIKKFPIFEQDITTGIKEPKRIEFNILDDMYWMDYFSTSPELKVIKQDMDRLDSSPRLTAIVENNRLNTYTNVEVIAILYDKEGNAFATSRSFIDKISDSQKKEVVFTWPTSFTNDIAKIEVVPKIAIEAYR